MKNEYEVRGDVTAIIINSSKYGRYESLISTSKLERMNDYENSWYLWWNKLLKSFYVAGHIPVGNGKRKGIYLHRWITNAPKGMEVDHINHDTLDNTDSNLRIVTHAGNMQNQKGANSSSETGIRGVSWNKRDKRWQVRISINNVRKHIGCFGDIDEAERSAIEARMKYMPYSNESI